VLGGRRNDFPPDARPADELVLGSAPNGPGQKERLGGAVGQGDWGRLSDGWLMPHNVAEFNYRLNRRAMKPHLTVRLLRA